VLLELAREGVVIGCCCGAAKASAGIEKGGTGASVPYVPHRGRQRHRAMGYRFLRKDYDALVAKIEALGAPRA
jgi:hypothetical protein